MNDDNQEPDDPVDDAIENAIWEIEKLSKPLTAEQRQEFWEELADYITDESLYATIPRKATE